jgi:hypothetical protein
MKPLILASITLAAALALSGCGPAEAKTSERPPENGAQYKKDKGVALTDVMKKAIGLKLAEVAEEKIAASFTVALSSSANEVTGWLTAEQAALVKAGSEVELRTADAPMVRGTVKRVEKAPYATLGEFEIAVETPTPLATGVRVQATFRGTAGEAVTSVPRSALLKTAEGNFVYAVNGEFYVRTPVKVGAMSGEHAEITDGLYAGDQIVTSPVMSLWLAELQVLRGGKACTCGH